LVSKVLPEAANGIFNALFKKIKNVEQNKQHFKKR